MHIRQDEVLWVEKYRPLTVKEIILPKALKATLQEFVDEGMVPNIILSGGPGVGKTTAAKAMFAEMGVDFYFVNGSMKGNIDTLRVDVSDFASSVSFTGKRKYVLLDEADYLNPNSTQPALRGFMEEFSRNCGFVLTCNYATRLIQPLHSRCPTLDFSIPNAETADLAGEFLSRIVEILTLEGVSYQVEVVVEIISRYFPDWRKIIGVLQNSAKNHKITTGALSVVSDEEIRKLFGYLKETNFTMVREWSAQHGSDHPRDLFRLIYEASKDHLSIPGQAQLALTINKFEYNAAFVANQEINLVAAMVEIMTDCYNV